MPSWLDDEVLILYWKVPSWLDEEVLIFYWNVPSWLEEVLILYEVVASSSVSFSNCILVSLVFVLFFCFVFFVCVRNTRRFVLYFIMRKYTSMSYIRGISVRYKWSVVQVQVCYTSKVTRPKTHNIIYINIPPQTQGGCETSLRLSTKSRVRPLRSDLVKISASWYLEETEKSLRAPWTRW